VTVFSSFFPMRLAAAHANVRATRTNVLQPVPSQEAHCQKTFLVSKI
jgi:hypothetical protein